MRDGISGHLCPNGVPFAGIINTESLAADFFPCLVAAIKLNETGLGTNAACLQDGANPATGLMPDGSNAGHGIMQLTSSWPSDWNTPDGNIRYAITQYLVPAYEAWRGKLQGSDLVRAIAATYNAGYGNALRGHEEYGNVDQFTTNGYGSRALANYVALVGGTVPGL